MKFIFHVIEYKYLDYYYYYYYSIFTDYLPGHFYIVYSDDNAG
jgi:hypothetical protein